jgi:hypothetical protein
MNTRLLTPALRVHAVVPSERLQRCEIDVVCRSRRETSLREAFIKAATSTKQAYQAVAHAF